MTADTVIRAQRRQRELLQKGELVNLNDIIQNLEKRDRIDSTRAEGPLVQAPDALLLDTSAMNLEDQIQWVVDLVQKRVVELKKKGHFDQDEA